MSDQVPISTAAVQGGRFLPATPLPWRDSVRQVAEAIGCSDATLTRIIAGTTLPSDELMKQGGAMLELGFERYSNLSVSERETLSERIGAAGGGALGFGAITAAIGALGIPGLSAAGVAP